MESNILSGKESGSIFGNPSIPPPGDSSKPSKTNLEPATIAELLADAGDPNANVTPLQYREQFFGGQPPESRYRQEPNSAVINRRAGLPSANARLNSLTGDERGTLEGLDVKGTGKHECIVADLPCLDFLAKSELAHLESLGVEGLTYEQVLAEQELWRLVVAGDLLQTQSEPQFEPVLLSARCSSPRAPPPSNKEAKSTEVGDVKSEMIEPATMEEKGIAKRREVGDATAVNTSAPAPKITKTTTGDAERISNEGQVVERALAASVAGLRLATPAAGRSDTNRVNRPYQSSMRRSGRPRAQLTPNNAAATGSRSQAAGGSQRRTAPLAMNRPLQTVTQQPMQQVVQTGGSVLMPSRGGHNWVFANVVPRSTTYASGHANTTTAVASMQLHPGMLPGHSNSHQPFPATRSRQSSNFYNLPVYTAASVVGLRSQPLQSHSTISSITPFGYQAYHGYTGSEPMSGNALAGTNPFDAAAAFSLGPYYSGPQNQYGSLYDLD